MTANDAWLADRARSIGGTDVSAILGHNPYRSAVDVWLEKTGRVPFWEGNLRTRFGSFAEQFVADEYERETGMELVGVPDALRNERYPFAHANVDRLVVAPGGSALDAGRVVAPRGWDGKTVSQRVVEGGEWGPSGSDQIPVVYLLQMHWYMLVTAVPAWDVSALVGAGEEIRHYRIRSDPEFGSYLYRSASEWWARHVVGDEAPEPSSESDVRALYPAHAPGVELEADSDLASVVGRMLRRRAEIEEIESEIHRLRLQVLVAMGDAESLRFHDSVLATFKKAKDSEATDWKAIALSLGASPDVVAAHTSVRLGSRRFLLKD